MADGITATVTGGEEGLRLLVHVQDADLAGKEASFTVSQRVRCKVSSPVHKSRQLVERRFQLRAGSQSIELGKLPPDVYTYQGEKIDIELTGHLELDDGIFFDTELDLAIPTPGALPPRRRPAADARSVHSPSDDFDFFANLRAIPSKARVIVIWLMLVGGPVVAANAMLGVRDQFVPDSQVWFYDHSGDDGSESPFLKALAGSGAAGFGLWMAIRRQLKRYMEFDAKLPFPSLARDGSCRPADVFKGRAGVALEQAQVRLVAYNREHGQYTKQEKDGNSTKTVTKSFTNEAAGVVLYEQMLFHVPANVPIEEVLAGEIAFAPMFAALHPPMMLGDSHGLDLQLEAQLLHPQFIDQEVVIAAPSTRAEDFREA